MKLRLVEQDLLEIRQSIGGQIGTYNPPPPPSPPLLLWLMRLMLFRPSDPCIGQRTGSRAEARFCSRGVR